MIGFKVSNFKEILKYRPNVNLKNNEGDTPLVLVAWFVHDDKYSTMAIRMLIKAGANLEETKKIIKEHKVMRKDQKKRALRRLRRSFKR